MGQALHGGERVLPLKGGKKKGNNIFWFNGAAMALCEKRGNKIAKRDNKQERI